MSHPDLFYIFGGIVVPIVMSAAIHADNPCGVLATLLCLSVALRLRRSSATLKSKAALEGRGLYPINFGQIWLYNANPTIGDEIGKTRPAVIVNNNEIGTLRLKVIVPITGWNDAFSGVQWMVRLEPSAENGLTKLSAADTFQVRSISQNRLIRQLGTLSDTAMREITSALKVVLSID